mgnify:CR=1 FL=1
MKQKIKQILNTITPQDLEDGCSRQVEEINNLKNKTMIGKIKYPLQEKEKDIFRKRLEEVLSRTDGKQVIILVDNDRISDYYQNVCGECLMSQIEHSARDYAKKTNNVLINFNERKKNEKEEILSRWIEILRGKASEYEHKARKNGEIVSSPDIDDICNEMEAFMEGFKAQNNPSNKQ